MTIILWLHVPHLEDYMKETKEFIESFKHDGFRIVEAVTPKDDEFSLWKRISGIWQKDDLIIIGQDNVPTEEMILSLDRCTYDGCVNPCISYTPSTGLHDPVLNQIDEKGKIYQADDRPEFVYYGGTGVCRLKRSLQLSIDLKNNPFPFPGLDSTLHKLFHINDRNFYWHCHYPIHKHNKDKIEYRHFDVIP